MKQFVEILLGLPAGQLSGADGWRVQWVGLPESGWAALGLLALIAALIWLTVRSYGREGDTPRRPKAALAAVRIAIILGIVAMLAQPAIELKRVRTDTSAVVVLVDDSMSMSLTDPSASATRLDRVRAALGGDGGALEQLRRDHPIWLIAFSTDSPQTSAYTRVLGVWDPPDDQAREPVSAPSLGGVRLAATVAVACGAWLAVWLTLGALRRRRSKRDGRAAAPRPWLLAVSAVALIVGFAAATCAVNGRLAARSLASTPATTRPAEADFAAELQRSTGELAARGFRTDLVDALRDGLDRLGGRRIAAAVLVTDGRQSRGGDHRPRIEGVRELLGLRGVRLITVCAGDPAVRPNLRVASVVLPSLVRLDATTEARVAVEGVNCAGRTATVRLFRRADRTAEWTDTGLSAEVEMVAGPAAEDGPQRCAAVATLPLTCDQLGEFAYRAAVDPIDGEPITHDNAARTRLTVSEARTRVLLISADAGWEFQYLRNFLLRDPGRYQVSVWQQNADAEFNQQASTGMRLSSLPRTLGELADGFDVVLLYDPAYTTGGFDATFARLLADFVSTHRGGVGYIASGKHTSDNLMAAGPFDDLLAMLPVTVGREMLRVSAVIGRDTRIGWPVRLTGAGRDHAVMQLAADEDRNERVWGQLPGIYWSHPVESIKPAAVALAVSSDPARMSSTNAPLPLVATHMYGRGPVLYVGFDSTWRWRYVQQGRFYRKFWSNVIDYLASYRQMKRRVVLSVAADTVTVGEPVRLAAEAYDEQLQPWSADTFDVRLVNTSDGDVQVHQLTRDAVGGDGGLPIYRRTVKITEPGEYRLTVAGVPAEDLLARTITVVLPSEEFDRPEADPALLAQLSDDAVDLDEFAALAGRIAPDRRRLVELDTRDLWNVPLAFVVLTTLLIVEWIGRKRYNMT